MLSTRLYSSKNPFIKVGKYWDYPMEKIEENTLLEIKMIRDFQNQLLNKIKLENWSNEEYKAFATKIKQVRIYEFIDCIEIYKAVISLSLKDSLAEIKNLINKENTFMINMEDVLDESNQQSLYYALGELGIHLSRRVLQFSSIIIGKEKPSYQNNLEDQIMIYQSILEELQIKDSYHRQQLESKFSDWVNSTIENDLLRKSILSMKDYIVEKNILGIKQVLAEKKKSLARFKDEGRKYDILRAQKYLTDKAKKN